MRKAIAMKCTQEQFEAVKGKLENIKIENIGDFEEFEYLINYAYSPNKDITNYSYPAIKKDDVEIHETWNEKVFIEACGIDIDYRITKKQILQAHNAGFIRIKEWFPEVFKKELVVGKWYYQTDSEALINYQGGSKGYGFEHNKTWNDLIGYWSFESHAHEWREATNQEVEDALTAEAKKRGYKAGLRITPLFSNGTDYYPDTNTIASELKFHYDNEELSVDGECGEYRIFAAGKWATIITTITKAEAEKRLGVKIE